ncbi:hypothetical protein RclHR1_04820016 [Rhizophagus clarus]|uniref:Uncharacterized protein n=1 Tax=Rhizophagus clarus TaxID=94130 RepID=A0A2Z6RIX9_9GLOM|nr:hypothetical protein RclHR1_04820016 [Rhizophagus clarus]
MAFYRCPYILKSGEVCNQSCYQEKGCLTHLNSQLRNPCKECGKIPTAFIETFNSTGNQPADNEIFELKQPTIGVYEFRAFVSFYRTSTIEIPTESINNDGDSFKINYSTSGNNQRFSIECDTCNLNSNSETWVKYHTSCLIKNLASGLCATGKDLLANVTQANCETASRWDLFGMLSPDIPLLTTSTPPDSFKTSSSTGVISTGELVGAVIGSIIGSTFITLAIGYWFIKDRILLSKNEQLIKNDPINNQIIETK